MLAITQELIDSIHQKDQTGESLPLTSTYQQTLLKCGTTADAEALLPVFLEQPGSFERSYLLPVIGRYGTTTLAQQLFAHCFSNNRLKEGVPEEVLHTLGQLRFAPAFESLLFYALDATSGYHTSQSAVLGLLHFSCKGYEQPIEAAIRSTFGKNIFNEFVPSLVCKLPNRVELLPTLYEHGSTVCSTDCNAGIILGFALSGEEGAVYFRKALLDPDWETASTGTGTAYWASKGMEYAGVRFEELYAAVQQETDPHLLSTQLDILKNLLQARLRSVEEPLLLTNVSKESLAAIYALLYGWQTPNNRNNILDVAAKGDREADFDALEELLLVKVEEELLLRCIGPSYALR